jgi:hypothetical protein
MNKKKKQLTGKDEGDYGKIPWCLSEPAPPMREPDSTLHPKKKV